MNEAACTCAVGGTLNDAALSDLVLIQERKSHNWEGGISTPAGLPRRGPRLAPALVEWRSTRGGKPPFPTCETLYLELFL
jgi:hypothetical protein